MLRLVGFFVLVLVTLNLLRLIPFIGGLFDGFLAFWAVAILLSVALSKLSASLLDRRKLRNQIAALGNVDSPHNQGKLGALLLSVGKPARALEPLRRAASGEPDRAEWHYRLGIALRSVRRGADAIAPLERAAEIDEEFAYGGVQLELARAHLATGAPENALDAIERFERNHGPSPESTYWRGIALRKLGRRSEARASFVGVGELASRAARFQRQKNRPWVLRAMLARLS